MKDRPTVRYRHILEKHRQANLQSDTDIERCNLSRLSKEFDMVPLKILAKKSQSCFSGGQILTSFVDLPAVYCASSSSPVRCIVWNHLQTYEIFTENFSFKGRTRKISFTGERACLIKTFVPIIVKFRSAWRILSLNYE